MRRYKCLACFTTPRKGKVGCVAPRVHPTVGNRLMVLLVFVCLLMLRRWAMWWWIVNVHIPHLAFPSPPPPTSTGRQRVIRGVSSGSSPHMPRHAGVKPIEMPVGGRAFPGVCCHHARPWAGGGIAHGNWRESPQLTEKDLFSFSY